MPRQQHYACSAAPMSPHGDDPQSSTQRQQSVMGIQTSFASSSAISSTFNPLFKVLFMFPSWYLFAIGFTLIISLRWKLPPTLRSNSKERDSWNATRIQRTTQLRQACHLPRNPFPKHLHVHLCWDNVWRKQFKVINLNFHSRLIPVRSPLLKNSHLVSDPPLTYMLKFSRSLCLMSCSYALVSKICSTMPGTSFCLTLRHVIIDASTFQAWCTFSVVKFRTLTKYCQKTLTQACPQEYPKSTSAFNGRLIHEILQFTMVIALRCTLHQHVNQDICCWTYTWKNTSRPQISQC